MPNYIGEVAKLECITEIIKCLLFLHPSKLVHDTNECIEWRTGAHEGSHFMVGG